MGNLDLGNLERGHVCKHGVRWPHACQPCDDAAWQAFKNPTKPAKTTSLKLTPYQARVLWGIIDGAADAGACSGGLEPREHEALESINNQLLKQHDKWKSV